MTSLSHNARNHDEFTAPLLDYIERAKVSMDYKALGTSQMAALKAAKMAGEKFLIVIEALAERPRTPDAIARDTGMVLNTARARCSNLCKPRDPETGRRIAPFVVPTGETGSTDADCDAAVLRLATPQEREAWQS